MLMLECYVGEKRYLFSSQSLVELLPYVILSPVGGAPSYIRGALNYRTKSVIVADFSMLMEGKEAKSLLHTRILLLEQKGFPPFGLICERVTEARKYPKESFTGNGIHFEERPFLGGLVKTEAGFAQEVLVEPLAKFLSPLFRVEGV
jgi:chemotaxis-related protein WspB